jgi:hypothetical protein
VFLNRALGEQWVQRATRRAGSNGRQVASRKLQAEGGYGTIGQRTERLQPAARGRPLINRHRQEERQIKKETRRTRSLNFFLYLYSILPPWMTALMGADELAEKNSLNRIVARESIRLQRIAQRAKVNE